MDVVEIDPNIVELDTLDIPEIKLAMDLDNDDDDDFVSSKPSINFGSGIELLMNDKNKEPKKTSSNVNIEDITKLEDELNELTFDEPVKKTDNTNKSIFGGLFGSKQDGDNIKIVTENNNAKTNGSNVGKSTANMSENKTWDGYGKFNNVPINLEKTKEKPHLSKEEELKEKFKYLRKLEDLEKKGVSLSKRYNMDSNLDEMIG